MTAQQTRTRLIDSALRILHHQGSSGLTLEAVAHEAGMSKGGLLHHFRSKDALVEAILRQLFEEFEACVQRYYDDEPLTPGRWLRAYSRATFDEDAIPLEVSTLLLGSLVENEALLTTIRDDFAMWQARLLHDGLPEARARVIRQAADAYWVELLLGVAPQDKATRQSLLDELIRLTEAV